PNGASRRLCNTAGTRRVYSDKNETAPFGGLWMQRARWMIGWALVILASSRPSAQADDWPQWLGPKRDGVWRETGIVETFPPGGPRVRWRLPIGAGYSGPAVAAGRVFVTDRVLAKGASNPKNSFDRGAVAGVERVLCIDEAKGELLWKYEYERPYRIS